MDDEEIERLQEEMRKPFKCEYIPRCEREKDNQCYSHIHPMCEQHKIYYKEQYGTTRRNE